jgi:hypothetical protein
MFVVNYRNEPVGLRVFDPVKLGPDGNPGTQADGKAGDLAFALASLTDVDRAIPEMNIQPAGGDALQVGGPSLANPAQPFYVLNDETNGATILPTAFPPPINAGGVQPRDPFTPLLRAFDGDLVKVKIQAGGHEHEHNAIIQGVKWPQGNSGFGPDRHSGGWRNAQSDGISEQFNFSMPVVADLTQAALTADYAYNLNAGQDGWWTGVWGVLRSYRNSQLPDANDLFRLPGNERPELRIVANRVQFNGFCPAGAEVQTYDVTAVLANDLLPNNFGATITGGLADNADTLVEGGPLNAAGGTLVYNPRQTVIPEVVIPPDVIGGQPTVLPARQGPLHDPTAILYVRTEDMVDPNNPSAGLRPGTPSEPLVLRANAGDCIEVTLRNALPGDVDGNGLFDDMPDLAGFNTLLQVVTRDRQAQGQADEPANSITTFNNNLIRPSSYVGLHPQLVDFDVTRANGNLVGQNPEEPADAGLQGDGGLVAPGEAKTYRWYAGDLRFRETFRFRQFVIGNMVATPVEFGGSNLTPADVIKQGQKGAIGALVIEPAGATWSDALADLEQVPNRQDGGATMTGTRADLRINAGTPDQFEDLVAMKQAGLNHRFVSGEAVPNIASEGQGIPEDSHDAGQKGINYGSEPAWFRFNIQPDQGFGNAGAGPTTLGGSDAELMFSNTLVGADPWSPVFTTPSGQEARMRLLNPTGVGRGSTLDLHGHVWQRDPYIPQGGNACLQGVGLGDGTPFGFPGSGNCGLSSTSIGDNFLGWYLGGQESWMPSGHFDIVLESAGGRNSVTGDYLFRDHGSFGVTDGVWGILRVE